MAASQLFDVIPLNFKS